MVTNTRAPGSTGAIRTLNQPASLEVKLDDDGLPKALKLCGRWVDVKSVSDRWRIDDEWWRETPISRMYYECAVDQELKVTVFRVLPDGDWFQQKV